MNKKTIFQLLNTFTDYLKKIPVITEITIVYSTTCTILFVTLGKILINYTPFIRLLIQTFFLLAFTHFGSFTIEDVCNIHNMSLQEESKKIFLEETEKILDELYSPQLENRVLNKMRTEFLHSNFVEHAQENCKEITPSDFYTESNIILALTTVAIIVYIMK